MFLLLLQPRDTVSHHRLYLFPLYILYIRLVWAVKVDWLLRQVHRGPPGPLRFE